MKLLKEFSKLYQILLIAIGKGIDTQGRGSKGFFKRLHDLFRWYLQNKELLYWYYILGFDTKKHAEQDEYLSWNEYDRMREKVNDTLVDTKFKVHYKVLSFDKFVSNIYLEKFKIPVVKNEALIQRNRIIWPDESYGSLDELFHRGFEVVFIKPVFGMSGVGIIRADFETGKFFQDNKNYPIDRLVEFLSNGVWVVQREIKQHPELNRFQSSAVHCLRVTTILNDGEPELVSAYLKVATGESFLDNWGSGSLFIGIDQKTGILRDRGYFKRKHFIQKSTQEHPDSKLRFEGFKIPHYTDALKVCLKGHKYHYGTFFIGWDVALTEDGPIVIEANCEPTIHPQQLLYGGMRGRFRAACRSYLNN